MSTLAPVNITKYHTGYAVLVGGSNGDGAWRGTATIVESIGPAPYITQGTVHGNLMCTVMCMSDHLLIKQIQIPVSPPHPICVGLCVGY
jgi:hypothetical protein